jgi:hypothetical protein
MSPMGMKYIFSTCFHRQQTFFDKIKACFQENLNILEKPIKIMYNILMTSRGRRWPSRSRNTDFWSVSIVNIVFFVKPKTNPFEFEPKLDIFQNLKKNVYNTEV